MNAPLQMKLLEDAPIDELRRQIKAPNQLLLMITAGRSILTVRSHRTGDRFTFRFRRPTEEPGKSCPIWVSVLGGPQGPFTIAQASGDPADLSGEFDHPEHRVWSFLGTIWPENGRLWHFNPSRKSTVPVEDTSMKAASWIGGMLPMSVDHLMEQADWWHEGRCGRCGRRLTVPESIESGFGPECVKHVEVL